MSGVRLHPLFADARDQAPVRPKGLLNPGRFVVFDADLRQERADDPLAHKIIQAVSS